MNIDSNNRPDITPTDSSLNIVVSGLKPDTEIVLFYKSNFVVFSKDGTLDLKSPLKANTAYSVDLHIAQSDVDEQTIQSCTMNQIIDSTLKETDVIYTPSTAEKITLNIDCKTFFFYQNVLGTTQDLWITDGTSANTSRIANHNISYPTRLNETLYFINTDNNTLYQTTGIGTSTGPLTTQVSAGGGGSYAATYILSIDDYLLFGNDAKMWIIDDTQRINTITNTNNIKFNPSLSHIDLDGIMYFFDENNALYSVSDKTSTIEPIANFPSDITAYPEQPIITLFDQKLYFAYKSTDAPPASQTARFKIGSMTLDDSHTYTFESFITNQLIVDAKNFVKPTVIDALLANNNWLQISLCNPDGYRRCLFRAWQQDASRQDNYTAYLFTNLPSNPFSIKPIYNIFDNRLTVASVDLGYSANPDTEVSGTPKTDSGITTFFRSSTESIYPFTPEFTMNDHGFTLHAKIYYGTLSIIQRKVLSDGRLNDYFLQQTFDASGYPITRSYSGSSSDYSQVARLEILGSQDSTLYTTMSVNNANPILMRQSIPYNNVQQIKTMRP